MHKKHDTRHDGKRVCIIKDGAKLWNVLEHTISLINFTQGKSNVSILRNLVIAVGKLATMLWGYIALKKFSQEHTKFAGGVVSTSLSLMGLGSAQRAMPGSTTWSFLTNLASQAMEQSQ